MDNLSDLSIVWLITDLFHWKNFFPVPFKNLIFEFYV